MMHRLRLATGLVLFSFVTTHLLNHALGLGSVELMDAGLDLFMALWQSLPGTALLVAAAVVHIGIALRSLYRRRVLALRRWEAVQLGLGLLIPPLLVQHALGLRLAESLYGIEADYRFVLVNLWVIAPDQAVLQVLVLLVAWVHGCIGLHYWLRLKPWYPRLHLLAFAGALLVPTLALSGFVAAGTETAEQAHAEGDGFVAAILAHAGSTPAARERVAEMVAAARWGFLALLGGVFAARGLRRVLLHRSGVPRLIYRDSKTIEILPGATVLETIRSAGIAHASVCGGRGRCSTCRVRVGEGGDALPPPSADELKVLKRIAAPPGVRLACQIRPTADLEVTPLLPPTATARDGFARPGYLQGQEREIAILFADLRGFTQLSETRLPFDVVFLLNRYFDAMGKAVERAGGRIDKFIGDGIMALFGVERGPAQGCRAALTAARLMAEQLDALNRALAADLPEPLRIGIGIHVGAVIVGEMGYGTAKSLTAIGDAVNTASRMEGLAKAFGVQLVVTEAVAARAGIDLSAFPAREAEVRGRQAPVTVRVIGSALALAEPETMPPETRKRETGGLKAPGPA